MSKDLGKSTSYAYYVAEGGTKTPQEYGEMLVNIDTVATRAEDAADSAAESATGALNSKNAAQTAATTATNKASEATTAATTATTKAGEASTSASTATSAKDTAVSASQTATSKATEATTAAATAVSAKDDAVAANTAAQSAKTAAQTAQAGAETAAASVQSSAAQIQTNADDISELKEDLNYFLDINRTAGEKVDSGWKFKANGTVTPDANFDIYAIDLDTGGFDILAVVKYAQTATSYGQFQNTRYTSASNTSMIIGDPITSPIHQELSVPTVSSGHIYFLYNVLKTDTESGIYSSHISDDLNEVTTVVADLKDKADKLIYYPVLRNGSAGNAGNVYGVCPTQIIPTKNANKITIVINKALASGADYRRFQLTTYTVSSGLPHENVSNRILIDVNNDMPSNGYTLTKDVYGEAVGFACTYYELTGSTLVPVRITDFAEGDYTVIYEYEYSGIVSDNYLLSASLLKEKVKLAKLGTIKAPQSFVKYNGKYYSSDGTNIYVQNSSFTLEQTVAITTGHANAFMLGTPPYAYISGWDNQTVYKINLDTLTLVDTITLPTTGYTTCAVDDIKGIIYVFQCADSSSVERYNFIVYDYVNSAVLSTKQIFAFGAMQACDLFSDRILMCYGLGTSALPNGYKVLDTDGNILADYFLPEFSTKEPEGICVDRDTHELLIGFYGSSDQDVYKITR